MHAMVHDSKESSVPQETGLPAGPSCEKKPCPPVKQLQAECVMPELKTAVPRAPSLKE